MCQMLQQRGARLMARDCQDMTPLHYAMQKVGGPVQWQLLIVSAELPRMRHGAAAVRRRNGVVAAGRVAHVCCAERQTARSAARRPSATADVNFRPGPRAASLPTSRSMLGTGRASTKQ